jgi:hypothetical protein
MPRTLSHAEKVGAHKRAEKKELPADWLLKAGACGAVLMAD